MKTYSLADAAALLHMSVEGLRMKAKAGKIKAAKPGRRWVFLESTLIDFLSGGARAENTSRRRGYDRALLLDPQFIQQR